MDSPELSISDVGSSISRRIGSQPPMSLYNPYQYRSFPRQYPAYGVPTAPSYYSYGPSTAYGPSAGYAPSAAYTTYSYPDSAGRGYSGSGSGTGYENMYYSLNGKLIRSYKIRSYRRAQKHTLDLFPEVLQGIASSRIQFYVMRPGYDRGRYVGLKSYISKKAWAAEIDNLADHETVGIEVRPSISFLESVVSCFNNGRFV